MTIADVTMTILPHDVATDESDCPKRESLMIVGTDCYRPDDLLCVANQNSGNALKEIQSMDANHEQSPAESHPS